MSYCSASDIRELLPKITTAVMSDTVVGHFITKADAFIDSKIAARYALPLTATPEIIKSLSADIASYYIMRREFTQDSQNKSQWTDEYSKALTVLDAIAAGKTQLLYPTTNVAIPVRTGALASTTGDYTPTFNVDDPECQSVDPTRLDAISEERGS